MEAKKNGIPIEDYYAVLEWKDANLSIYLLIYPDRGVSLLSAKELKNLSDAIKSSANP